MGNKLVVLSDMWGAKRGLWITSYLGYLQQYYNITYYNSQQLANLKLTIETAENISNEFENGGIDTAVAHLLKKENEPSHFLTFGIGGTIAWKAQLEGLPMESLFIISSNRMRQETALPKTSVKLVYGEKDQFTPSREWAKNLGVNLEVVPNFGHELYSDEKVIGKVCQDLLAQLVVKQPLV
ncbi:hypothetical protein SAMN04487911_13710 [Arenibacter nanhaiticus]|uniref:Alpha/beta hydrolase n=1 Tax=Arenibacter nanhaiticus TaxID=558155 RepID=A0A1M6M544_9FLAO|nr:hypothetical protein [Arenibacter nanhaiticus]SHJ78566.1 hypothetical protein SAMN04487911_13710 [Arenibacter nanhaiticus]